MAWYRVTGKTECVNLPAETYLGLASFSKRFIYREGWRGYFTL